MVERSIIADELRQKNSRTFNTCHNYTFFADYEVARLPDTLYLAKVLRHRMQVFHFVGLYLNYIEKSCSNCVKTATNKYNIQLSAVDGLPVFAIILCFLLRELPCVNLSRMDY